MIPHLKANRNKLVYMPFWKARNISHFSVIMETGTLSHCPRWPLDYCRPGKIVHAGHKKWDWKYCPTVTNFFTNLKHTYSCTEKTTRLTMQVTADSTL
jgi:hypothetical protein